MSMADGKGEAEGGGEGDAEGYGEAQEQRSRRFLDDLDHCTLGRMDTDCSWPWGVRLRVRQRVDVKTHSGCSLVHPHRHWVVNRHECKIISQSWVPLAWSSRGNLALEGGQSKVP